jgi:hypothetical protein
MPSICPVLTVLIMLAPPTTSPSQGRPVRFSDTGVDANGIRTYSVESPYQAGKTKLRILLPDRIEKPKRYRVVYVLPVEARDGRRYGDGLAEIKKLGLHNKHELICVWPTFSHLPWYADHPTDKRIRQESYLIEVVLPLVERTFPAIPKPQGRLLLGFSKSGWGAWSLLLRRPDVFGKAAAWDAPLTKDRPDQFGMGPIFATQANFMKYHVQTLLRRRAADLGGTKRLALLGYGNFREHHQAIRRQLIELGIAHEYRDGPKRKHHWASSSKRNVRRRRSDRPATSRRVAPSRETWRLQAPLRCD